MKSAVYLAVVFLATVIPASLQEAGKPHSWMPQGRFGKRMPERLEESAVIREMLNSKSVIVL